MKQRCLNSEHESYANYGGRGITIHEPWQSSYAEFAAYIRDTFGVDDIPDGLEIDRIDNDRGYEPGNLRLSDKTTQANNRRTNVFVEYQGERMTISEAARKSGLSKRTLWGRITNGEEDIFRSVEDVRITFRGVKMTISELARMTGTPRNRLNHRIRNQGLSPEEAINPETYKGRRTDLS